jgi:hypothetical protein
VSGELGSKLGNMPLPGCNTPLPALPSIAKLFAHYTQNPLQHALPLELGLALRWLGMLFVSLHELSHFRATLILIILSHISCSFFLLLFVWAGVRRDCIYGSMDG